MTDEDEVRIVRAAARVIVGAALDVLQRDAHYWSDRPCETCRIIGALVGKEFGCYVYARERKAKAT